jgi:hypothetical protein
MFKFFIPPLFSLPLRLQIQNNIRRFNKLSRDPNPEAPVTAGHTITDILKLG